MIFTLPNNKKLKGFLETEEGMNRMVAFAENLGDMVIKIVQNMDVVLGALGALMGASIGFMFGGPVGAGKSMLIERVVPFLAKKNYLSKRFLR